MKLEFLLEDVRQYTDFDCTSPDMDITGITDDTRQVKEGNIFICVKGKSFDGHTAAADMLEKGAALVVCDHDLGLGEKQLVTADTRGFYGRLVAAWYNHPEKKLRLIGVTGTNGKTTIATIIHHILNNNGMKAALIGTAGTLVGNEPIQRDDSTPTTPKVSELYPLFAMMLERGCKYVVMEVSSFALDQNRIGPAQYCRAIFTNLTRDHLDYHGDMESYYQAKKLLFTKHCEAAYINRDDEYGRRLLGEISCESYSYSTDSGSGADICADNIAATPNGSVFRMIKGSFGGDFSLKMVGSYNVSNALAAIAVCLDEGIPAEAVIKSVADFGGVRGRCEIIPTKRDFTLICDYAHSPDALENALKGIRPNVSGRLICLFGCGGDRDRTKRPLMAKAAAQYADYLIVTSDNPRNEDPDAIIDEIFTGLNDTKKPCDRVTDRQEAIFHAVRIAKKGDAVVLAGKGHEDYQILKGGVHIHFDEREVAAEALAALDTPPEYMTVGEIAHAISAKPYGIDDLSAVIPASLIDSDSRTIQKGGLFFALRGDRFDGHDYVPNVTEKGVCACVTEREIEGCPCLVTDNTRLALLRLAGYYRRKFSPVVVGVTGSVGKTTTKELTSLALSSRYKVLKTAGNRNNEIGAPFTLLGLNSEYTAAVIEMGMSNFGEIERLSAMTAPDICLITNIGYSHMENLGSREGILSAKLEILKGAKKDAVLIVSGDDDMLSPIAEKGEIYGHRVISCSVKNPRCEYCAVNISSEGESVSFDILHNGEKAESAVIPCAGVHNVSNALLAYAVAMLAGCDSKSAAAALCSFKTDGVRQHIEHKDGFTVIADCYNAAPASMKAAIDTLCDLQSGKGGRKICVLGDMLELGDTSPALHREIGEYAAEKGIDMLFCCGKYAGYMAEGATEKGLHAEFSADKWDSLNFLSNAREGDFLLFKASHGIHLEEVIDRFYSNL